MAYLAAVAGLGLDSGEARAEGGDRKRSKLFPVTYNQVSLADGLARKQMNHSIAVLLALSDDSMLKPFRERAGLPAPGADLGGWYDYFADYGKNGVERGFAPAHAFGQWMSALARSHATDGGAETRAKLDSLIQAYTDCISPLFFKDARFPAYTYDKLVIGLVDAHRYGGCSGALAALEKTTEAALPYLPARAEDRLTPHPGRDDSYTWDESYTLAENLFIAYNEGIGDKYLPMAKRFLLDSTYFEPLANGKDVLTGKHAYSYMNALSSAMQAYLTLSSDMHLKAAQNAFEMILKDQSYATGGWGPDETFRKPDTGALGASLDQSIQSFETPCGAYAHLKLTNYLTCVTGESRFGDSAEQVFYNTVLGALPMQTDGRAFYYANYHTHGKKTYSTHCFPCCAGTLPQVSCDYGKHAYFLDDEGVYVSLYLNSSLKWQQEGKTVSLSQESNYPAEGKIALKLALPDSVKFALRLRIPAWVKNGDTSIKVNGKTLSSEAVRGGEFFALDRLWQDGDTVELNLPLPLRLEKVDDQHNHLVALICGPRVLFMLESQSSEAGVQAVSFRAQDLLAARRCPDKDEWLVSDTAGVERRFVPFTAISDETYATYVKAV